MLVPIALSLIALLAAADRLAGRMGEHLAGE